MHMAMLMGATEIILVGVDMCELGGQHHGHEQHVRFHGLPAPDVYKEYRDYTAAMRAEIAKVRPQVSVLSLSPLLGACDGNEDYKRLVAEKGIKPLPQPKDTSEYKREHTDKPL
jgi:hypothetical protein